MKKKSFNKKLVLNKKTISNLAMGNVKGGRLSGLDNCETRLNCTFNNCDSRNDYSCMFACWPK